MDRGIVGIITNNSFLNGITHRRMRNKLMEDFSSIYILNLHGNSLIGEQDPSGGRDENVFPIRVGVSIAIFIKDTRKSDCAIYYRDLFGRQDSKYRYLDEYTVGIGEFTQIDVAGFNRAFRATRWGRDRFKDELSFFVPPLDAKKLAEYGEWWGLNDIFDSFNTGVQMDREELLTDFDEKLLSSRMKVAFDGTYDKSFVEKYNIKNSSSYQKLVERLDKQEFDPRAILKLHYKPFDFRSAYYKPGFTSRPAFDVMQHLISHENIALISTRATSDQFGCLVTDAIAAHKVITSDDKSYVFPLYLYQQSDRTGERKTGLLDTLEFDAQGKKENFKDTFRAFLKTKYKHSYKPQEVVGYIYALQYSSSYRREFSEVLKIDFPRIPFPKSSDDFKALSRLGQDLMNVHLLKEIPDTAVGEPHGIDLLVSTIRYDEHQQRLYINGSTYYDVVSKEVWEYQIGGYCVLENYLKSRKDHVLTNEDAEYIQSIVKVLHFTLALIVDIERAYLRAFAVSE